MKTSLKYVLIIMLFAAIVLWNFWPKTMKLPNSQIDKLMTARDICLILSDSSNIAVIKEIDSIRYSVSPQEANKLHSTFQKISINEMQYFYSSSYQKFESIDDAKSLQNSNRLLGKIPGVQKSIVTGIYSCGEFEIYRSMHEINIFGRCDALIYTISIKSDSASNLRINKSALSALIKAKISSITSKK